MSKTLVSAVFVLLIAGLLGCSGAENSDGSSKSTYSSCKITSSNALFNSDRQSSEDNAALMPQGMEEKIVRNSQFRQHRKPEGS
ncbi:hypothetical protein QUF80_13675 [Desulfococcaceae bacterium HSG8]|nr:hypothetical protein [Desulfococcaceae bacterium HSG8]